MVLDLLSVSLDPIRVILVLREIDIQLVFSRRHRWLYYTTIIYVYVYIYII